jgi:hypothetical protein
MQAREWVFPAGSESGHLAETTEDRNELSKWGNDLRQTFRTIATAAGISEIDAKLLMNHSIPGVNAGYITRHKLLEDHLRRQQQAISTAALAALGSTLFENRALRVGWGVVRPGERFSILRSGALMPAESGLLCCGPPSSDPAGFFILARNSSKVLDDSPRDDSER